MITEGMGEEEIILTNTYLNSKKRNLTGSSYQKKKSTNKKGGVVWKN